jgi:hypothetical protein
MYCILKNLSNKGEKTIKKAKKKQRINNPGLHLHLGSPNRELTLKLFFFVVWTSWFSFQNDAM